MDKRIGRFAMSRQLAERNHETARAVMGRCLIVRCEMMYAHDTLEYVAISPDFDEVPEGMIIPEYDVIISGDGQRIEFKRSNAELWGDARLHRAASHTNAVLGAAVSPAPTFEGGNDEH